MGRTMRMALLCYSCHCCGVAHAAALQHIAHAAALQHIAHAAALQHIAHAAALLHDLPSSTEACAISTV